MLVLVLLNCYLLFADKIKKLSEKLPDGEMTTKALDGQSIEKIEKLSQLLGETPQLGKSENQLDHEAELPHDNNISSESNINVFKTMMKYNTSLIDISMDHIDKDKQRRYLQRNKEINSISSSLSFISTSMISSIRTLPR